MNSLPFSKMYTDPYNKSGKKACEVLLFSLEFHSRRNFALQVGSLREVSNKAHNAELKLFLEVEFGPVKL